MNRGNPLAQNGFKELKCKCTMHDFRLKFAEGKQREFLKAVIQGHFGSQAALGRFLGFNRYTIRGRVNEKNNMPKSIFERILDLYPQYRLFVNFIEKELPWNWGKSKGCRNVVITDKFLGKSLFELSPEYRTFPLEEKTQPTIRFLEDKNLQTKIWALRFAFTTDDCISLSKRSKPELGFACCNRNMAKEWQAFLRQFGLNAHIARNGRYKQGVAGLRIYDFKSIRNFYKLGGFIDGVKISRKSTKYMGMQKNGLLRKVVELGIEKGLLMQVDVERVGVVRLELTTFRSPN